MPSWPSRILSSSSAHPVESPITSIPLDGGNLHSPDGANQRNSPLLRSPQSQYALNPPPGSPQTRSSHVRSASHPFPSLDGSVERKPETNGYTVGGRLQVVNGKLTNQSIPDVKEAATSSTRSPVKNGKAPAKDDGLQTGNCLTCDSTVRWPKQLDVYRCTNCIMINDLKPAGNDKDGSKAEGKVRRKCIPLTAERTRDLVEQCVKQFLRDKVDDWRGIRKAARDASPRRQPSRTNTQDSSRHAGKFSALSSSTDRAEVGNANSFPPSRTMMTIPPKSTEHDRGGSSTSQEQDKENWRLIFKSVEDYLISCFQDCDSLNSSFMLVRPATARYPSQPSGACEKQPRRDEPSLDDDLFSELDAKTLLLGDIGENGQWWTGERHAKARKSRKDESVDKKPTRFDWNAIYAWYDTILCCGRDWRSQISTLPPETMQLLASHEDEIDQLLSQGRYHVQRTLLKGVETLLRRPGRPLQNPDDVRFLVILLANPLLYPSFSNTDTKAPVRKVQTSVGGETAGSAQVKTQGIANGHHSGIIKRILGLIANLPLPCHQALISWFCRVSETQFHDFVELVGGFVSYRLARQKVRSKSQVIDITGGLIPDLSGPGGGTSAHLHAAIGETAKPPREKKSEKEQAYRDDWQIKTSAKVMSLLFAANLFPRSSRYEPRKGSTVPLPAAVRNRARKHSQLLPTNFFYNTRLDYVDLVGDFEAWESRRGKFAFCQYPMFLSIWAKIHILEYDARRQMEIKARDAFFTSIMKGKAVSQFLVFKVRRDCLVEDSMKNVSEVVGGSQEEIKKGLRIQFVGEEGIDAGGLRKEWFLLLTREVFDPEHGLFIYDQESNYCYFNPFSFETSDQYFLIGVLLGLAIYNSTILDVSLPPVAFRKLLAAAPQYAGPSTTNVRPSIVYTLADLAEWRPSLAKGLQQLLDHEEDDVEEVFCRDFVIDVERYGQTIQVPLCSGGEKKAVTNSNRKEFVDLYLRYLLDGSVARQFEPFKRGFFSVCGGNALSLFRPEEIELVIRGSDEPLDTASIQGVAMYENCSPKEDFVRWFWDIFESANPKYQREILTFITGSDRIPAMGATSLVIKISCLGGDTSRYPTARTCFNVLGLWPYSSKEILAEKLLRAVQESEGFGLK